MRSLRGPWGLWPRAVMKKAFSAGSLSEPWPMPDSWGFLILPSWEGAVPAMNRMSAVWSAFPRPALPWASPMPRTWALPAIRSMPSARPCRRKRSFVPCFAATSWGPLRSRSPRPGRTWGASSPRRSWTAASTSSMATRYSSPMPAGPISTSSSPVPGGRGRKV